MMYSIARATLFCSLIGAAAGYSLGVRSALASSRRMRGGITAVDSMARVPEGAVSMSSAGPVSYTHLTLPTILLV